MIYIEYSHKDPSLFKVDRVEGYYYGWNRDDTWEGDEYYLYPNEETYIQAFLAPSILDRW